MSTAALDLGDTLQALVDLATVWGLKLLAAIVVFMLGRIVAGWARKLVKRGAERAKLDARLVPFFAGIVYYVILAVVVIAALGLVGIQTASLLAVLGAAGLAVGLALQGTLSNFAAGVMLLVFRPFHVGDYIDVGGTAGSVNRSACSPRC